MQVQLLGNFKLQIVHITHKFYGMSVTLNTFAAWQVYLRQSCRDMSIFISTF